MNEKSNSIADGNDYDVFINAVDISSITMGNRTEL